MHLAEGCASMCWFRPSSSETPLQLDKVMGHLAPLFGTQNAQEAGAAGAFWGPVAWILKGSPCYLGAPRFEYQTTNLPLAEPIFYCPW